MNWDQLEGKWKQYQGEIKSKWGELTENDLNQIAGQRDQLVGRIQERYGIAKEQAQREVDEYMRTMHSDGPSKGKMRPFHESIRGRTVIAADGQAVGEVADLIVDSEAWRVDSLQLKLNNEVADKLGVARGKFHAGMLDVPVSLVQSIGDNVILSVPCSELRPTLRGSGQIAA